MGKIISLLLMFAFHVVNAQNYSDISYNYLMSISYEDVDELLFVSIRNQKMYHIKNDSILNEYIVSTSKYGVGNIRGTNKTPLGLHEIKRKIGDEVPINGILNYQKYNQQIAQIYSDTSSSKNDDITSRILWLDGLEKYFNKNGDVDSFNRYIYIHGTSEEGKLGTIASDGCIRMSNSDVVELYDKINVGTKVLILDK